MANTGFHSRPASASVPICLVGIVFIIEFQRCLSQSLSIPVALRAGSEINSSKTARVASLYNTSQQLEDIQSRINNSTNPFCYNSHSRTKDSLKNKEWTNFIKSSITTIVYPFCVTTKELGNKLGNYFTELACAQVSGAHFVAIHKQFDETGSRQGQINNATSPHSKLMLDLLPDTFVHPFPAAPAQVPSILITSADRFDVDFTPQICSFISLYYTYF